MCEYDVNGVTTTDQKTELGIAQAITKFCDLLLGGLCIVNIISVCVYPFNTTSTRF